MKARRLVSLVIAIAVPGALAVTLSMTAVTTGAAPSGTVISGDQILTDVQTLTGPNVHRRDATKLPALRNSKVQIRQGSRLADGICHQQVNAMTPKNADMTPVTIRLMAIDLDSCRYQVEIGNPTTMSQLPAGTTATSSEIRKVK